MPGKPWGPKAEFPQQRLHPGSSVSVLGSLLLTPGQPKKVPPPEPQCLHLSDGFSYLHLRGNCCSQEAL